MLMLSKLDTCITQHQVHLVDFQLLTKIVSSILHTIKQSKWPKFIFKIDDTNKYNKPNWDVLKKD